MSEPKTDWQVSHEEDSGRISVIFDMAQDPDDASGRVIKVSGRGHARFAEHLAALLQSEGASPDQV